MEPWEAHAAIAREQIEFATGQYQMQIANGCITTSKLAAGSIRADKLTLADGDYGDITLTPGSGTFLRADGTWATPYQRLRPHCVGCGAPGEHGRCSYCLTPT